MAAPDWLTARPVAHRGLHALDPALVENTLGAVEAAAERGFSVEVDLQLTADDGLVVFHDYDLSRLTGRAEAVRALPLETLRHVDYATGGETIAGVDDLFALVGGRVPLVIELKSLPGPDAARRIVEAFARALARYGGPVAAMSFDPDLVHLLRERLPDVPRGILAGDPGPAQGSVYRRVMDRVILDEILHAPRTRPDFIGYAFECLPRAGVTFQRRVRGVPVLAWTVRSEADAALARRHADQIIFERFLPAGP